MSQSIGWRYGDAVGSSHSRVHAVFYKYVTFTRIGRTLGYQNLINAVRPPSLAKRMSWLHILMPPKSLKGAAYGPSD